MKKWESKEIEYLINNYNLMTGKEIGNELNRTEKSIHKKAKKIGLKKEKRVVLESNDKVKKIHWSDEEIKILKNNYLNIIFNELCNMIPNRSPYSIRKMASRLNIKKEERITIHQDKLKYIIDNFYIKSFDDIAKYVGLTAEQVYHIGKYKGLKISDKNFVFYSDNEIKIIKDNWGNRDIKTIMKLIPNRNERSIISKASNLGLYCDKTLSHTAKDGVILNSFEERDVYEYIKYDLNIDIKSIGFSRKHKLYNEKFNENYCPDFVIEDILDKPIFIEYYGLINSNYYEDYICKAKRKNNFYNSQKDIYFIDLYPQDLKQNNKGIYEKLLPYILQIN